MPLTMMLDNKMKLMMKKRMRKVLGRMFFGCGVLGMLAFLGCDEHEEREVLIEADEREMTFGAEGGIDTIRVEHGAVVEVFSVGYDGFIINPDTVYAWEGKDILAGDWYQMERSVTDDFLTVRLDSNKSERQRKLVLNLLTLAAWECIQITQEGMEKPVKREQ